MNEHISSMLQFPLCEKKYRELIKIMEEKNTSPAVFEVIKLIKEFRGLSNMRKDTMIKQKMASYKTGEFKLNPSYYTRAVHQLNDMYELASEIIDK